MKITIEIPDDELARYTDAVCGIQGYDPGDGEHPGPHHGLTREERIKDHLLEHLDNLADRWKEREARRKLQAKRASQAKPAEGDEEEPAAARIARERAARTVLR